MPKYITPIDSVNPRILRDTATQTSLLPAGATSITVSAANVDRVYFEISNLSNTNMFVKLYAASVDNILDKGIWLRKNTTWKMDTLSVYTGEISIIASSGSNKAYTFTEY